jgi:hypothetical protein
MSETKNGGNLVSNESSIKVNKQLGDTQPLQTLAKGDKLTVTAERLDDGKLRCTSATWSDAVVIFPGEIGAGAGTLLSSAICDGTTTAGSPHAEQPELVRRIPGASAQGAILPRRILWACFLPDPDFQHLVRVRSLTASRGACG